MHHGNDVPAIISKETVRPQYVLSMTSYGISGRTTAGQISLNNSSLNQALIFSVNHWYWLLLMHQA
ncbi:hypothetical protein BK378_27300 [Escherichia coli]|uniref:Uncharacterized protein n=1 Tax=Escherichia coli TaxID=562 RepID=A0A8E2GQX3_ECOLX|nr:hypothetical protein BK378_27300 [Escherichia coli]OJR49526.1 hypothetical protein BK383_25825 [Escherichia coli]